MFLEILQNSQEKTCARTYFLIKLQAYKACNFIKKEALAQVFSSEFFEIFKKIFFTEHPWAAASAVPIIVCSFMETFIDVFI